MSFLPLTTSTGIKYTPDEIMSGIANFGLGVAPLPANPANDPTSISFGKNALPITNANFIARGSNNSTAFGVGAAGAWTGSNANPGNTSITAFGYLAGAADVGVTGTGGNTYIGERAGLNNTTSSSVIAIGTNSFQSTSGDGESVYIGVNAGAATGVMNGGSNVAVGQSTLLINKGGSNVAIGNDVVRFATNGSGLTGVGCDAIKNLAGAPSNIVAIGTGAFGSANYVSTGQDNMVIIGNNAANGPIVSQSAFANQIIIGTSACSSMVTGSGDIIIGNLAMLGTVTSGGGNIVMGGFGAYGFRGAGIPTNNILLGNGSFSNNTAFSVSIANVVAIGSNIGTGVTTDVSGSTVVGQNSLASWTGGLNTTVFGSNSARQLTTGANNLVLGPNVGSTNLQTGSNNILIGTGVKCDVDAASTSNELVIANGTSNSAILKVTNTNTNNMTYFLPGLLGNTNYANDAAAITGTATAGQLYVNNIIGGMKVLSLVESNAFTDTLSLSMGPGALPITSANYTAHGSSGSTVFGVNAAAAWTGANAAYVNGSYVGIDAFGLNAGAADIHTAAVPNLYVGQGAGQYNTTGSLLTCIGPYTGQSTSGDVESVYVGQGSGGASGVMVSGFNVGVGISTLRANLNGQNVAVGCDAVRDCTNGSELVAVGCSALKNILGAPSNIVAIGVSAFGSASYTSTGQDNMVVIGANAANGAVTSQSNFSGQIIIGTSACNNMTHGNNDVIIGNSALQATTTSGGNNIFMGTFAGYSFQGTGIPTNIIAIGGGSFGGGATSIPMNGIVIIGSGIAANVTADCSGSTIVGQNSAVSWHGSINNTIVGGSAARQMTTGGSNTIIGSNVATNNLTTGSNNILIGTSYNCDVDTGSQSNSLVISTSSGYAIIKVKNTNNNGMQYLLPGLTGSTAYASDAAAKTAGVAVGQLYLNNSISGVTMLAFVAS